jgi:DNA-directed RNA polymerase subunit RPC12/RpoP
MMGPTQDAGVLCKRCETPIVVKTVEKVADEFAVTCPKCGQRDLYRIKDIKTLNKG